MKMDYTSVNEKEIINWLKSNLDAERYRHSIGTAKTAVELSKKFGLDDKKAYLAGLLHDCAKCLPEDELLYIITNFLSVKECELINPKTFHAPVGAYLAEEKFGVTDIEILSAIRWHTLGHLKMTNFEKIIFIADKIEPETRPEEYINLIKPKLEIGLDAALLECYKGTIKSLAARGLKICTDTIDIYNELISS